MPVIYPPKLTQIYGNTFYYPSSIVNTTPPSTNVLSSDGNGATFYQDIRSQFISTTAGLGSAGYVSSSQLTSTVAGLGSANYVSTTQLQSTVSSIVSFIPIFNFGQGQTDVSGNATVSFTNLFTSSPGFTVSPLLVNTNYQSTLFVVSSLTTSNTRVLSFDIFKSTLVSSKDFSWIAIGV
jgi:hypothetical protein